jgi:DNA modification methylase
MLRENGLVTNEEKRIAHYQDGRPYTISSTVRHNTPLEKLNLNWREQDLRERDRTKHVHRLHPYLGKYIPQLVEIFLRKYFTAGDTVLDPFSGSGTTLVQANELGINSVGYDVSAFNVLLAHAKTAFYDVSKVKKEVNDLLIRLEARQRPDLFNNISKSDDVTEESSEYLKAWFAPQALIELLDFRRLISDYENQDLLKVILSRAARSARLTTHFDLDFPKKPQTEPYFCYKHSRTCFPTTDAYKFIRRYALDTLKRIEEFSALRTKAKVKMHHADSRDGNFAEIDGVITSPPYVGLIDYHEQHAYAYHLLGLHDQRDLEIGAAAKGSSIRAKKSYQEEIASVFKHAAESLRPGGRIIVVVGDRANLYPEIAEMVGLEQEATVQRHVNRRTGRRSNDFYESVLIWRKQKKARKNGER